MNPIPGATSPTTRATQPASVPAPAVTSTSTALLGVSNLAPFDGAFASLFEAAFHHGFNAVLAPFFHAAASPAPSTAPAPAAVSEPPAWKTAIYARTPRS